MFPNEKSISALLSTQAMFLSPLCSASALTSVLKSTSSRGQEMGFLGSVGGFGQRACKCEWRGVGYIWPWLASRRSCQKTERSIGASLKKKNNKKWKIARQGLKVGLIKSRKARKHPDRQINRYICRSPQVGFQRYRQKDKPTDTPTSCLSLFINSADADAGALCPPYRDGRMKNKRADSCHPPSTDGLSECVGGSIKRRRGQAGRCYSGAEECIS